MVVRSIKRIATFYGKISGYVVIYRGKDKNTTQGNLVEPVGSPVAPLWCKSPSLLGCGSVELYYFNGQPTNSIYRIDDKIIVVNAKNSKEKSVYLPYTIFQDNGEKGMYQIYLKEIETIIKEAQKVELVEGNNNANN